MPLASFPELQHHILDKLKKGLSPQLTYHCVHHTLDVLAQVNHIAKEEGWVTERELELLQVAALYHDAGFLYTYQQHEARSCALAKEEFPRFGVPEEDINVICGLIMATQVPQKPQTRLQEIMCDADLDYLGRPDFFEIGETLYQEFLQYGVVKDERDWNEVQVRFLENHTFFTCFSKNNRETLKQTHLHLIKEKLTLL